MKKVKKNFAFCQKQFQKKRILSLLFFKKKKNSQKKTPKEFVKEFEKEIWKELKNPSPKSFLHPNTNSKIFNSNF